MSVRIAYDGEDCAAFAELGLVGGGIRQYVCCDRAVIPLDTVEGRRDWYSGTTLVLIARIRLIPRLFQSNRRKPKGNRRPLIALIRGL